MKIEFPRATSDQSRYIEILCNDLGFDTRAKRNDFISLRVNRPIKYLDELSKMEASKIISELRELRDVQTQIPDDRNFQE